jgi:prophage regulatory protein
MLSVNNKRSVNQRGTDMTTNTFYQLIRRPQVLGLTARSKSALQLDEKAGLICPPISIGDRAVAYIKYEVEAVIQARIEGQSTEQIKQFVQELINQRTKAA